MYDYEDYDCYNCGVQKNHTFKDGTHLYLQNSGHMDIVCVKPNNAHCSLCEVDGFPNVYKWVNNDKTCIFALHAEHGRLSDANIADKMDVAMDQHSIIFTDKIP